MEENDKLCRPIYGVIESSKPENFLNEMTVTIYGHLLVLGRLHELDKAKDNIILL